MSWKLEGSYFETCSCDVVCPCRGSELAVSRATRATRSKIDAFGIQYEGNAAFSTARFSWAA